MKTLKDTKLTEIDIALMEIRIESMLEKEGASPYEFVGAEMKKYVDTKNPSYLPTLLKDFFKNEQSRIRSEGKDERSIAEMSKEDLGRRFWECNKDLVFNKICGEGDFLYKIHKTHGQVSPNAIIVVIASTLDIGGAFTGLLCGLSLIVASTGIETFCKWEAPAKEPVKKQPRQARQTK